MDMICCTKMLSGKKKLLSRRMKLCPVTLQDHDLPSVKASQSAGSDFKQKSYPILAFSLHHLSVLQTEKLTYDECNLMVGFRLIVWFA